MVRILQILTKEISELRSDIKAQGIIDTGLTEAIWSQKPLDNWFLGDSPSSMLSMGHTLFQPSNPFSQLLSIFLLVKLKQMDKHSVCITLAPFHAGL